MIATIDTDFGRFERVEVSRDDLDLLAASKPETWLAFTRHEPTDEGELRVRQYVRAKHIRSVAVLEEE